MRWALVAALILLETSSPVQAQTREDAQRLVDRGVALRSEGRDAEALAFFSRAYDIEHAPSVLAQLALAEQALARWVAAERDLTRALDEAGGDSWIAANSALLRSALEAIRDHLGSVHIAGAPAGAVVLIGGVRAGVLPGDDPIRVAAGRASIEVRAAGYAPAVVEVEVAPRGDTQARIALRPISGQPARTTEPPQRARRTPPRSAPPDSTLQTIGVVGLVAAGALLAMGAIAHGIRQSTTVRYNEDPTCGTELAVKTPDCLDDESTVATANALMIAGYAGGAGVAIASIALILLSPAGGQERDATATGVSCGPAIGSYAITCSGRF